MKKVLHKWQYGVQYGRYYPQRKRYFFLVYCIWLTYIPTAGEEISKKDYRGFIWEVKSPTPTVRQSFIVPNWLRWLLPYKVYTIPLRWTLK